MLPSYFDASTMGFVWAIPFLFFLGTLALGPTYFHEKWEKYDIHTVFILVLGIFIALSMKFGIQSSYLSVKHTFFHDYVPFIIMMGSLYVVSSGIHITTKGSLKPLHNVIFLFCASFCASVIGTTGASMLLIRPFIALNHNRRNKTYLIVFFIFLVSNIGGSLTPIGDPPLFLGFLNGVKFFWTLEHIFTPMVIITSVLLMIFYFFDKKHYKNRLEDVVNHNEVEKFSIHGTHNFIFILLILLSVIISSINMEKYALPRDIALVLITLAAYASTQKNVYHMNRFSFHPLREIALVFLGIFVTLIPITAMLHGGGEGVFSEITGYVNPNGFPDPLKYYLMTGFLSGFLDNAPTYLLFFHMAGGNAESLMTTHGITLMAISMGSVFFGALSYIGNAPNLMVKAIAERAQVTMPSFGGYMVWSFGILAPVLLIFGLIYFR